MSQTMQEVQARLEVMQTTVGEIASKQTEGLQEIQTELQKLRDQIAAGGVTTPEVDTLLDSMDAKLAAALATAQTLADIAPPVDGEQSPG